MPKLKQAKIIDKAENLLANLAKGRRVGNKTGKLKLTEEQQNKAELLKALDDMEKSRQLNESKRIMGALDTIFKQDLYKLALKLYENNQIGYSCRDLAVFNKQQPNQPVPASTLNVPFDV